jgi:hypothetical protein
MLSHAVHSNAGDFEAHLDYDAERHEIVASITVQPIQNRSAQRAL